MGVLLTFLVSDAFDPALLGVVILALLFINPFSSRFVFSQPQKFLLATFIRK
jgi:hypothetical protein